MPCEEKDLAEPGLLKGDEGNVVPVGLTSSLCLCIRSKTTLSRRKGDCGKGVRRISQSSQAQNG